MSMAYHAATILMKMDVDDSPNEHGADLGLSLSEKILVDNEETIESLNRGDRIRFNSTI